MYAKYYFLLESFYFKALELDMHTLYYITHIVQFSENEDNCG